MAKVTTIIPAYNCERYIKEAIKSVLSQSYGDIELIVVDDNSTDKTGEIIRSFGPRIKCIHNPTNGGPSIARNLGIKQASGEYIAFLDHDDIWMPDKIEKQIEIFNKKKDVALVYSNSYNINIMGLERGTFFDTIKPHRGFVLERLLLDNFIPTSSVVIRKDIVDEIGLLNEHFLISQDYDLYLRIAEKHKIDFLNLPLFKRRVYQGSASSDKRRVMLEEAIFIVRSYRNRPSNNRRFIRKIDRIIAKYMFYIAIWALDHENRRTAINCYIDCIKTGSFDYKIIIGSVFFILPKTVSILLIKRFIRIQ